MSARCVRIAGGGPAGLCAALLLARAGESVELREKHQQVGRRFAGAVHGIENWSSTAPFTERLRSWGIDLGRTLTPCHELILCNEHTRRSVSSELPLFYLVGRGSEADCLEGTLLRLAREAGAELRLGERFEPGTADIDATGPQSTRRMCVETGIHFRTRSSDVAAALVARDATPYGYAYLLVRDGRGSLSTVRFDGQPVTRQQLETCARLLTRHVPVDIREARPAAGYGSYIMSGQLRRSGSWAIGESAGLQDFVWGFGIRRALESGALAARCWLEGAPYAAWARREFGIPDRASLVNRYFWDTTATLGFRAYVHLLNRRGDVRASLLRATQERLAHRLLYPLVLRRMKRRFPHLTEQPQES